MPIQTFKIKGTNAKYIMNEDIFRKIIDGQVFDLDRKTKKWFKVELLSLN